MGRRPWLVTVGSAVAVLLFGGATPASAHGGHDTHRLASGSAGSFSVSVWVEGSVSDGYVPITIGVTSPGTDPAEEVTLTALIGDRRVRAEVTETIPGYWSGTMPFAADGSTPVFVEVDGVGGGEMQLLYSPPGSQWWMKLAVSMAIAQGIVFGWWLLGRARRAFQPVAVG